MSTRKHNIPSLDGLRAISISLVMFSHLVGTKNFPIGYHSLLPGLGTLGVRVFFVISGFLITGLLIREHEKTGRINLKEFYFRRTLRIFPVYYFYLLVVATLTLFGFFNIPWSEFLKPVTYTTNIFHTHEWMLGHSWSLSIEEQFYLVWPGLLVLLGFRSGLWLLLATVALMPIGRFVCFQMNPSGENHGLSYGILGNLDSIALGCVLAILRDKLHANVCYLRLLKSPAMLAVPVVLFLANATVHHPKIYYLVSISLCNLCVMLCLDWCITFHESAVGRLLNSRPFVAVGLVSYSLYLWQQPFLNPKSQVAISSFPINLLLAIAAATLSYFAIEKTSLTLRHYLDQRWFRKGDSGKSQGKVTAASS